MERETTPMPRVHGAINVDRDGNMISGPPGRLLADCNRVISGRSRMDGFLRERGINENRIVGQSSRDLGRLAGMQRFLTCSF